MPTYFSNLGDAYLYQGKSDSALYFYQDALAIDTKYQDIEGLAYSNLSLGNLYAEYEEYSKAEAYLASALDQAKQIGDRALEVSILNAMARVLLAQNVIDWGLNVASESYELAMDINFPEGI